jgi:hypothetical protein
MIETSGKPVMTVDAFSLHHSRRMFGLPRITDQVINPAEVSGTQTGRLVLVALLYDFSSENGDDWALATNITRWLRLEAKSSEPFGNQRQAEGWSTTTER